MEELLQDYAGDPAIQVALLFIGPFILEEAAILGGSAISAAGELPPLVALAALYAGIVVSDWALFAIGVLAGRVQRLRRMIGEDNLAFGQTMLSRGVMAAAVTARLVPWLLLPIFVASGFLRVGFLWFAVVNALIALIYVNILFWALYEFDALLFDALDEWGWAVIGIILVAVLAISRVLSRRSVKAVRRQDKG